MNLRAAIFDFNGTLCDDEPLLFQSFGELCADRWGHILASDDYFNRLAGHSDREILAVLAGEALSSATVGEREATVDEMLSAHGRRYREIVAQNCPIRAGTVELVQTLAARSIPLAIVTGAQRADVLHVLSHSPIPNAFAHIVAEEDVDRGKPDPEGFLLAAAVLDVEPADIVVFEDSKAGIRGAIAAGMTCVALTGTHDAATLKAETPLVVADLSPEALNLL